MTESTKRDFGSFQASNVQALLSLTDEEYVPPKLPVTLPTFDFYRDKLPVFGKTAGEQHFLLDQDCCFLNHGAFGGVLREALQVAQEWQRYVEQQPLRFFDRQLLPLLVYVTRRLAQFVGCEPLDLVLLPNVTTAINCVVRSLHLQKGDVIFCLNTTYGVVLVGAVKKLLRQVCGETGAILQEEVLDLPLSDEQQVCSLVEERLQPGTRLAVFDHIPSNMPFILPVQQLAAICRNRGVPVLVDGAHALGGLPLDLRTLGVDFYASNGHKWFCAPKGCAFMYVDKKYQGTTKPLVISHGFGSGFNSEFIWSGLRDYSPFLAMLTVLDFWKTVGVDNILQYMYHTAQQAASLLVERWNSSLLAPSNMFGSMVAVRLPSALYAKCTSVTYDQAEVIQNLLYQNSNIEVPIKAINGHLYVRISAHIYNHADQYDTLAKAVLKLVSDNPLAGSTPSNGHMDKAQT